MAFFLLLTSLRWLWRDRNDYFASGNLSIYYPVTSRTGRTLQKKLAFRGPDFFVVLNPRPKKLRNSWVVENEDGKYPDVIVELLSKSTRKNDRGKKKDIYETIFKTPEYFLFDPQALTLEGYHLVRGRYVAIRPDARGRLWSDKLGVALGVHDGSLRLFTEKGRLVPLPDEVALHAMGRAKQEAARARQEAARAERIEAERARLEQENARLLAELRALEQKKKKPSTRR
jgi:Uma2 family endonuclease